MVPPLAIWLRSGAGTKRLWIRNYERRYDGRLNSDNANKTLAATAAFKEKVCVAHDGKVSTTRLQLQSPTLSQVPVFYHSGHNGLCDCKAVSGTGTEWLRKSCLLAALRMVRTIETGRVSITKTPGTIIQIAWGIPVLSHRCHSKV